MKEINLKNAFHKDLYRAMMTPRNARTSYQAELVSRHDKVADILENAIVEAEGRATVRTLTARELFRKIEEINEHFAVPRRSMEGLQVLVDCNAQNFPNAYKYVPESTIVELEFRKGSWRVTNIYRGKTHCAGDTVKVLYMPDDMRAELIEKYMSF